MRIASLSIFGVNFLSLCATENMFLVNVLQVLLVYVISFAMCYNQNEIVN